MELTDKEEKYSQLVVKLGNKSEALRQSYDCSNMTDKTINEKASRLSNSDKISTRIKEIRKGLAERNKISKDDIIAGHKQIIEAWEELWILGKKEVLTANETKRFYLLKEMVKGSDYRGAWQEIAKLTGAYEPDKLEVKDTTYRTNWGE